MRVIRFLPVIGLTCWFDNVTAAVTHRKSSLYEAQAPLLKPNVSSAAHDTSHAALQDVMEALQAMQVTYFDLFAGTWSNAIDWTAAVAATHISSTLASMVEGLDLSFTTSCSDMLRWDNVVNQYYSQISFFFYAENAFAVRNQAFDDMLWVVLEWLEVIKFADVYKRRHTDSDALDTTGWHGLQLSPLAAHRARIFYELASRGWDDALCRGGMTWNSRLDPYKNAITNELFIAASISMYLYFPGDNSTAPFVRSSKTQQSGKAHNAEYLENAIKSYKWLSESGMRSEVGLYQDGFHVNGWRRYPNGTVNPGTGRCDDINTMVYTYNQGVMLTANRGLWLATGARSYLDDGHALISSVIRATGWPNTDRTWHGLGRAGVLEEYCDHGLYCSQDGQTFKGIFFHHLSEFCRPLHLQERDFMAEFTSNGYDEPAHRLHMEKCAAYARWIEHNADAAMLTRNPDGLFGMWWGIPFHSRCDAECQSLSQRLPPTASDHVNPYILMDTDNGTKDMNDRGRGRTLETQTGALAVLKAKWLWRVRYN